MAELVTKSLIVCVDDDETMLATVARCLRREPSFEVRSSTSCQQVLGWIANEQVAVVVSDYEMPEMTGAQLAGQAKRIRPETVRILLTGMRTLETAIDGIHQGEVFRFINKPFDDKALRQAVLDGVQRHQELLALSGDRERRERREALRKALESEYPGISTVERADGVIGHDDDTGAPCTKHPAPSTEWLMGFAALGSRLPSFHHDVASKLQSLVMSLDEIGELAEQIPELRVPIETAQASLKELDSLFKANRALAKAATRARVMLPDLMARAAERSGVKLRGEVPTVELDLALSQHTHAFALLLDSVAGSVAQGRQVDINVRVEETRVQMVIAGVPAAKAPPNQSELIAVAGFLIMRDGGTLRCGGDKPRFTITLVR
jgi:FixJ family two-component response regulator